MPLVKLRVPQSVFRFALAASWLLRSPLALALARGLQGLRASRVSAMAKAIVDVLSRTLRSSSECFGRSADLGFPVCGRNRAPSLRGLPPLRFLPLQRFPVRSGRLSQRSGFLPSPLAGAPAGFLDPLTPSTYPNLVALFHATSARGVFPSELFPPVQPFAVSDAVALLSFTSPLFPRSPTCLALARSTRRSSRLSRRRSPSGLCSTRESAFCTPAV